VITSLVVAVLAAWLGFRLAGALLAGQARPGPAAARAG
jgi:hypothetical protein